MCAKMCTQERAWKNKTLHFCICTGYPQKRPSRSQFCYFMLVGGQRRYIDSEECICAKMCTLKRTWRNNTLHFCICTEYPQKQSIKSHSCESIVVDDQFQVALPERAKSSDHSIILLCLCAQRDACRIQTLTRDLVAVGSLFSSSPNSTAIALPLGSTEQRG